MFFKKYKILIWGAGWLGIPLYRYLKNQIYDIQIIKRSLSLEIAPEDWIKKDIDKDKLDDIPPVDIWIYMLPPQKKEIITPRIQRILSLPLPERIFLISSTSIYPDEPHIWIESDIPPGGAMNTSIETTESLFFETHICTIMRCAGLVGPGRNPAYFLAGKKYISKPLAPVNLVHLQDVIQAVAVLLQEHTLNEVYNICAPFHLTRQKFYTQMAQLYHLTVPEFLPEEFLGKEISGNKIISQTCFKYSIQDFLSKTCY